MGRAGWLAQGNPLLRDIRPRSSGRCGDSPRCLRANFDRNARPAELQLVARLQLGLVDLLAIHNCAGCRAEVDNIDLPWAGNLHDRMHPRHALVVDPQMARLQLANLDDVLFERLAPNNLVAVKNVERNRNRHTSLQHNRFTIE